MSKETRDSDYRPKRKTLQKRTPRTSRQVDSINYTEYETESDTGSSAIISEGENTVIEYQSDSNSEVLESLWTLGTFKTKVEEAEETIIDLAQQCMEQQKMAKQTESGMEKMFQLIMQMRQEYKVREDKREKERLDREERRELDRIEREESKQTQQLE